MRRIERIPVVLEHIDWYKFIDYLNIFDNLDDINETVDNILDNIDDLREYWYANPDQRLTQVLVNTGLIQNKSGGWYYVEEVDYLIGNGYCKPEDINFWGTYGKDRKGPLKFIVISDMDSDHIESCLRDYENKKLNMSNEYVDMMRRLLDDRGYELDKYED